MKESDDIGKLFALFDGSKAKQYREVHETDQQRETVERWPLFKRVQVGAQAHAAASSSEPAARPSASAPLSSPARSTAAGQGRPFSSPAADAGRDAQPSPSVGTPSGAAPDSVPAPAGGASGDLKSLFRRLEGPAAPPASAEPPAVDRPEQPAGSIRSLFDRLRRP